jgi:hypothetical protein
MVAGVVVMVKVSGPPTPGVAEVELNLQVEFGSVTEHESVTALLNEAPTGDNATL